MSECSHVTTVQCISKNVFFYEEFDKNVQLSNFNFIITFMIMLANKLHV